LKADKGKTRLHRSSRDCCNRGRATRIHVNADDNPQLAARYRVDAIPRLMVFKGGRPVAQHSGLASKAHLNVLLTR
jgi:thioredoxin-like negative regulator of GroEL